MERAKEDIPDLRLVDVGASCMLFMLFYIWESVFVYHVSSVFPWWFLGVFFLGVNMNPKRWLNADPEDALIELLPWLNAWEHADSTEEMEKVNLWLHNACCTDLKKWKKLTSVLWSFTLSGRHVSNSEGPCFGGPTSTAFTSEAFVQSQVQVAH